MRRNFFKSAAVALAGLFALNSKKENAITAKEIKVEAESKHQSTFVPRRKHGSMAGIAGHGGSNIKKSNKNRDSHNAKVKKRKAQAAR